MASVSTNIEKLTDQMLLLKLNATHFLVKSVDLKPT